MRGSAVGRSQKRTPAPATRSRSPPISARDMPSRQRSPDLRRPTQTKTSATTPRSRRRSRRAVSEQRPASERPEARRREVERVRDWYGLEFGSRADFDDASLEWRRLFAEALGTFLLVLVAAGAAVVDARSDAAIGRSAAVVAPGLMVMAIILFMGAVSGAHLNPAVMLAFAARRDFPWKRVPGYVLLQLVGATLACLFLWAVLGKLGGLGATEPGAGIRSWQALLMELVLTAGLVSVILGTASSAQNVGAFSALAVGGYIALAGLWSSPISGASMNPARSFGPDLVNWDLANYRVYLVGPIVGAASAVGIAYVLRGPGGDVGGIRAARGVE